MMQRSLGPARPNRRQAERARSVMRCGVTRSPEFSAGTKNRIAATLPRRLASGIAAPQAGPTRNAERRQDHENNKLEGREGGSITSLQLNKSAISHQEALARFCEPFLPKGHLIARPIYVDALKTVLTQSRAVFQGDKGAKLRQASMVWGSRLQICDNFP